MKLRRAVGPAVKLVITFLAILASESLGCSRVPEQALRDEQARSRTYRDAYETQAAEISALKEKLAAEGKRCPAATAPVTVPAESAATAH